MLDVQIENAGSSLFLFRLLTANAEAWVEEHVGGETSWWGDALVVETRFAGPLAQGMLEAGLEVA